MRQRNSSYQVLYYGVAGKLYWTFLDERPAVSEVAGPFITVRKSDNTDLAIPYSAVAMSLAAPAVTRTLAAAAAQGETTITLDATTSVAAEIDLLVDGGSGRSEWVRGRSWDSGTKVLTLYEPLEYGHASGSTVYTTTLEIVLVAAAQDAQMTDCRFLIAAYMASSGTTQYFSGIYDVKLHYWKATLQDHRVKTYLPDAKSAGWKELQGLDAQISEGERRLREECRAKGIDLDNLINDADAETAHLFATLEVILTPWSRKDPEVVQLRDFFAAKFQEAIDNLKSNARWTERGVQDFIKTVVTGVSSDGRSATGEDETARYARKMRLV